MGVDGELREGRAAVGGLHGQGGLSGTVYTV